MLEIIGTIFSGASFLKNFTIEEKLVDINFLKYEGIDKIEEEKGHQHGWKNINRLSKLKNNGWKEVIYKKGFKRYYLISKDTMGTTLIYLSRKN